MYVLFQNVPNIQKAFEKFVQPETLDCDNAYHCPRYVSLLILSHFSFLPAGELPYIPKVAKTIHQIHKVAFTHHLQDCDF
jgi:hypothetical protein